MIRVSKKPEDMNEQEHLKAAIKELQGKMKAKGEKFTFNVAEREVKLKARK